MLLDWLFLCWLEGYVLESFWYVDCVGYACWKLLELTSALLDGTLLKNRLNFEFGWFLLMNYCRDMLFSTYFKKGFSFTILFLGASLFFWFYYEFIGESGGELAGVLLFVTVMLYSRMFYLFSGTCQITDVPFIFCLCYCLWSFVL